MSELRKDPIVDRWVVVADRRAGRPQEFRPDPQRVERAEPCPFCPGHEAMTPPEVLAIRPRDSRPDSPGWQIRVVPNKFPAVIVGDGHPEGRQDGPFQRLDGVGVHEVIVETPEHGASLATMGAADVAKVLQVWQMRIAAAAEDSRLRHALVFKNHGGAAGATIEHAHGQLLALPLVPASLVEELAGAARHFAARASCAYCDLVRDELAAGERIVLANGEAVAVCAFASRVPYETWIVPRRHGARFEQSALPDVQGVASILRPVLSGLERVLDAPSYNLVVHSAPFGTDDRVDRSYHWHIEVLPRVTKTAGFEWGSGFHINTTRPEEAARRLKEVAT